MGPVGAAVLGLWVLGRGGRRVLSAEGPAVRMH